MKRGKATIKGRLDFMSGNDRQPVRKFIRMVSNPVSTVLWAHNNLQLWQSHPVLNRLHRAMELARRKTLPQGLLGQAIDYTLKRWTALDQFITDGVLEIDSNGIKNLISPSALGKRNWMFIDHPEAGERSAVIYTLLGSCRRHGINPFDYLKDLFIRLPAAKITEIKQFTPAARAKTKAIGREGSSTNLVDVRV
jgi:hypothetical protein